MTGRNFLHYRKRPAANVLPTVSQRCCWSLLQTAARDVETTENVFGKIFVVTGADCTIGHTPHRSMIILRI